MRLVFKNNGELIRAIKSFDNGSEIKFHIPGKGRMVIYDSEEYPVGGLSSLTEEDVKNKIIEKLSA